MNINRHNYEEFFLLYADNELPADQRLAVEDFVQQNADLKEELNLFLALHLDPDTNLIFDNKESLLHPVILHEDAAPATDDEEKLLRLIDLELSLAETTDLKQKLSENPALMIELEILSKTKLQPDLSVVFPDKSILYKISQEKVRVFQMSWLRVAVAAAIILAAGLLWISNSVEETTGTGPLAVVTDTKIDTNSSAVSENNDDKKIYTKTAEAEQPIAASQIPNSIKVQTENQPDIRIAQQAGLKKAQNEEQAFTDNSGSQLENITTPGNEQPLVNVSPNLVKSNEIIDRPSVETDVKSNYATDALMSAQDAVEVVTAENNNTRKTPIRGIVRKANRLFNKVTNPDPEKLHLKVANFEIALAK
ncbi:MAG: hypothetical protein ACRC2O_13935 [Chitinophagaceae bacterium]